MTETPRPPVQRGVDEVSEVTPEQWLYLENRALRKQLQQAEADAQTARAERDKLKAELVEWESAYPNEAGEKE